MTLLAAHLEQISVSCQGIDSLPYVTSSMEMTRSIADVA